MIKNFWWIVKPWNGQKFVNNCQDKYHSAFASFYTIFQQILQSTSVIICLKGCACFWDNYFAQKSFWEAYVCPTLKVSLCKLGLDSFCEIEFDHWIQWPILQKEEPLQHRAEALVIWTLMWCKLCRPIWKWVAVVLHVVKNNILFRSAPRNLFSNATIRRKK